MFDFFLVKKLEKKLDKMKLIVYYIDMETKQNIKQGGRMKNYKIGDKVEYYNYNVSEWMPGVINSILPDGSIFVTLPNGDETWGYKDQIR